MERWESTYRGTGRGLEDLTRLARKHQQGVSRELDGSCRNWQRVVTFNMYRQKPLNARSFESPELEVPTTYLLAEIARQNNQTQLANDYFNHATRKGQKLVHELKNEPARVNFVHKPLEMAFEQGKKNRAAEAVDA